MRWLLLCSVAVLASSLTGCVEHCRTNYCVCTYDGECDFGLEVCNQKVNNCRFMCEIGSTCRGSCGAGCYVTCRGKRCEIAVGGASKVYCDNGTCVVACYGPCAVIRTGGWVEQTCEGGTIPATDGYGGCVYRNPASPDMK
jgi:hypothetical protein